MGIEVQNQLLFSAGEEYLKDGFERIMMKIFHFNEAIREFIFFSFFFSLLLLLLQKI